MTVLLNNNFSGGPDGTAITAGNSGQFGDNAFDGVAAAASDGVLGFADCNANGLARPTAQYALEVATGASAPEKPFVTWTTSLGSQTTVYSRFYLWFSSMAPTTYDQALFELYVSGILVNVSINLGTSTSPIVMYLYSNAAVTTRAAVTPVADAWNRVEFYANILSANSTGTLNLYYGDDVDTNNISDSATQTTANYGYTYTNAVALGQLGGTQYAFPPFYVSNLQVNNYGWPGPAPFRYLGSPGYLPNQISPHTDIS
jgi:hypothetical protein